MDTPDDQLDAERERLAAAPIHQFTRWISERIESREVRERRCALIAPDNGDPQCGVIITLRASSEAGHRGFCSPEHAAQDQYDYVGC